MRAFVFVVLIALATAQIHPKEELADMVCHQPKKVGNCKARIPRFYYSYDDNECLPFFYGGCGENLNNFKNYDTCMWLCER
uniref:Protease inhibitor n=1 Tax=Penaeus japonicus TaxID=27405 RepID=Q6T5J7_PENJP|nr:protease inhibitor [Penaeus japonicus]